MNINLLTGHIPAQVLAQIPEVQVAYELNTPLRLAHFLSQCAHESIGFTAVRENLNYSAAALQKTFRKYFPTAVLAEAYARQPERIASRVYADRMGNGNEASKQGWVYRGRGYIQLTGKINYSAFDKTVPEDILANPDLVATKYPLLSAAWFWKKAQLNAVADRGSSDAVVESVTKIINGGLNGLEDRKKHFKKFYGLLS